MELNSLQALLTTGSQIASSIKSVYLQILFSLSKALVSLKFCCLLISYLRNLDKVLNFIFKTLLHQESLNNEDFDQFVSDAESLLSQNSGLSEFQNISMKLFIQCLKVKIR